MWLTLIEDLGLNKNGKRIGLYQCSYNNCNKQKITLMASVKSKLTKSCGCLLGKKKITHGLSKSPERGVWKSMIQRCYSPKANNYHNYGGRGIRVCEQWLYKNGFLNFYTDMGPRPSSKHSIDRIDNNGDYCKENCKWVLKQQQMRNCRRNHNLICLGITTNIAHWVEITGLNRDIINHRIKDGWSVEETLLTPKLNKQYQPIGSKMNIMFRIALAKQGYFNRYKENIYA